MYLQNPVWNSFYEELDPKKRKKIMEELLLSEPDDGANEFRKSIWEKRYVNPKDKNRTWDLFLLTCSFLPSLYRKRKFFMTDMKKEMERTLQDLCLKDSTSLSEEEKGALYQELYNAGRRYFKTCKGSKYGSKMLGFSKANDDQKRILAGRDAWQMSYGLYESEKMDERYLIFCYAVKAAFVSSYADGEELFAHAEKKGLAEK